MKPFAPLSRLFARFSSQSASSTSQFLLPASQKLQKLTDLNIQREARRCLKILGEQPTASQWNMILSPASSTNVIAGAGSGKSTTLILRLLILYKLVGISLEELHVFSFTVVSTEAFRTKLLNMLKRWETLIDGQKTITPEREKELATMAKRTVSTFHSVLNSLARNIISGGPHQFFERLDDRPAAEDEQDAGPFVSSTITASQSEILTSVHVNAYIQSSRYRELIRILLDEETRQLWRRGTTGRDIRAEQEPAIWESFLRQEQEYHGYDRFNHFTPAPGFQDQADSWHVDPYRAVVADWLRKHNIAFWPLAPFSVKSPITKTWDRQMRAAFKVGDIWIDVERFKPEHRQQGHAKRSMAYHEIHRRKFISTYTTDFDRHKVLIPGRDFDDTNGVVKLTPQGDNQLQIWLNADQEIDALPTAPMIRVRLPGDIKYRPVTELFYQEGLFTESLGLEVEQLFTQGAQLDLVSAAVAEALPIFWREFQKEMKQRHLLRYHDVLSKLRDPKILLGMLDKIRNLQHIFIDEFQDISPEFIDWFQKNLRVQSESGADVSIIAIGDDYQAIYAWRGSHPVFLMDFAQFFSSVSSMQVILEENFRSRQAIIDAAEVVLEGVQEKQAKHGKSIFASTDRGRLHPVRLVEAPLSWQSNAGGTNLWQTFSRYVAESVHDLEMTGTLSELVGQKHELSVYVLSRTNETNRHVPLLASLERNLLSTLRQYNVQWFNKVTVEKYTYHRSKGLEADFVLLLDDSQPSEKHPWRELVFSQAAFTGQNDNAYQRTMDDETRRLAYVAMTRARLGAMWVPLVESERKDKTIQPQGCFVLVKNHLQRIGKL